MSKAVEAVNGKTVLCSSCKRRMHCELLYSADSERPQMLWRCPVGHATTLMPLPDKLRVLLLHNGRYPEPKLSHVGGGGGAL